VIENRVLRRIFGLKREVWMDLHNEEPHYVYSSIIMKINCRKMRWAAHVAKMLERRNTYRTLLGKLEGKRPLEKPRRRWVYNIEMVLDGRRVGVSGSVRSRIFTSACRSDRL
jgi:hypothetical protein